MAFPACRWRRVEADFSGGDMTGGGGVLLLRQADRLKGLISAVARCLGDDRQRGKVRTTTMLRQRVYALALGWEDGNDHEALRHDPALHIAVEKDGALASPSTLYRFENTANHQWAWSIHEVLVNSSSPPYQAA